MSHTGLESKFLYLESISAHLQHGSRLESEEGTNRDCCSGLAVHTKEFGSHLFKLVKSWPLLRLTLVVMFCWFAASATYYGVSLNAVNLSPGPKKARKRRGRRNGHESGKTEARKRIPKLSSLREEAVTQPWDPRITNFHRKRLVIYI